MFDRLSEVVDPVEVVRVSPDRWLQLLGYDSRIEPWTFGYTDVARNDGMERRTLPEHVFYFVTHGGIEIVFEQKSIPVSRGEFIWIMAGVTHETRPLAGAASFMNYYARPKILTPDGMLFRLEEDCVFKENAWSGLPYIKQLIDELQAPHLFQAPRVRALLQLLTSWAMAPMERASHEERILSPQQRTRLIRHMEQTGGNGVTPDVLANLLGLTPVYFARVFRHSFGVAPRVWLVQERIRVAATMLSGTKLSIKEVALQLGYSDIFLFSRQFKQVMGISPRAYREGLVR